MVDYTSVKEGKKTLRCRNCLGYFPYLDANSLCNYCGKAVTSRKARKKLYATRDNEGLKKYF